MEYEFQRRRQSDLIWWVVKPQHFGKKLFSFDRIRVFDLDADYPAALTVEQKKIFDRENPFVAKAYSRK